MSCILSYNGMSGISLLHEPVDSLTTMVSATEIGQSDPGWNNIIDMNPNISPNSFEYNGRHQLPNMHHQRGGIHVSKVRQTGINHQIIMSKILVLLD
uniref:ATP-dependent RNA helicase n=1 Tax=Solanum tuberosum TaxID=4113 RepID=M1AC95_SOLTU